MTDCNHDLDLSTSALENLSSHLEHDTGLPLQLSGHAQCEKCGEEIAADYNLAFVDGDNP